ncbi:MAG: hypothetical protein E7299_04790 [Lachnospiraceae bacterium]|nr:hypothetical protein [Lachnospiraceae bacterium]
MDKLYERIDFQNDMPPALNADNLNAISKALEELDLRVISIAPETLLLRLKDISELLRDTQTLFVDAEGNAILAKSYAAGGTGSRDGEDTDNAKYYKEQARDSANKAEIYGAEAETYANAVRDRYTEYYDHLDRANNPHNVTKEQIGLDNVPNVAPIANLLTTIVGSPLDATMGKELNDKITALQENGAGNDYYVGTCTTSASTADKVVTISDFNLKVGAVVHVKFSYTNTSSSATLNVSSTGAKAMYYMDGTRMYYIPSGVYHSFIYDGTYWRYMGTQNAIIASNYERYGIKMEYRALIPLLSGYSIDIGTISKPFNNIYSSNIYVKRAGTTTQTLAVLPPLPLVRGNFCLYDYHQILFTEYSDYVKSVINGVFHAAGCNIGCNVVSGGSGNYEALFLFRIMGYVVNPSDYYLAKPFVADVLLSTSQTNDCSGEYTNCATIETPYSQSITLTLTGVSVNSCGVASGAAYLKLTATSRNIHISEIDLMP